MPRGVFFHMGLYDKHMLKTKYQFLLILCRNIHEILLYMFLVTLARFLCILFQSY